MHMNFTDADRAFQGEVRDWLKVNLTPEIVGARR